MLVSELGATLEAMGISMDEEKRTSLLQEAGGDVAYAAELALAYNGDESEEGDDASESSDDEAGAAVRGLTSKFPAAGAELVGQVLSGTGGNVEAAEVALADMYGLPEGAKGKEKAPPTPVIVSESGTWHDDHHSSELTSAMGKLRSRFPTVDRTILETVAVSYKCDVAAATARIMDIYEIDAEDEEELDECEVDDSPIVIASPLGKPAFSTTIKGFEQFMHSISSGDFDALARLNDKGDEVAFTARLTELQREAAEREAAESSDEAPAGGSNVRSRLFPGHNHSYDEDGEDEEEDGEHGAWESEYDAYEGESDEEEEEEEDWRARRMLRKMHMIATGLSVTFAHATPASVEAVLRKHDFHLREVIAELVAEDKVALEDGVVKLAVSYAREICTSAPRDELVPLVKAARGDLESIIGELRARYGVTMEPSAEYLEAARSRLLLPDAPDGDPEALEARGVAYLHRLFPFMTDDALERALRDAMLDQVAAVVRIIERSYGSPEEQMEEDVLRLAQVFPNTPDSELRKALAAEDGDFARSVLTIMQNEETEGVRAVHGGDEAALPAAAPPPAHDAREMPLETLAEMFPDVDRELLAMTLAVNDGDVSRAVVSLAAGDVGGASAAAGAAAAGNDADDWLGSTDEEREGMAQMMDMFPTNDPSELLAQLRGVSGNVDRAVTRMLNGEPPLEVTDVESSYAHLQLQQQRQEQEEMMHMLAAEQVAEREDRRAADKAAERERRARSRADLAIAVNETTPIEMLEEMFPRKPTLVLLGVLRSCGGDVQAAAHRIMSNKKGHTRITTDMDLPGEADATFRVGTAWTDGAIASKLSEDAARDRSAQRIEDEGKAALLKAMGAVRSGGGGVVDGAPGGGSAASGQNARGFAPLPDQVPERPARATDRRAVPSSGWHRMTKAKKKVAVATPVPGQAGYDTWRENATQMTRRQILAELEDARESHRRATLLRTVYKRNVTNLVGQGNSAAAHTQVAHSRNADRQIQALNDRIATLATELQRTSAAGQSARTEIDLHGMYVGEAISVVSRTVAGLKAAGGGRFHLITGRGKHSSDGRARLRPAVVEWLRENGVRHWSTNPGAFEVIVEGR